MDNQQQQTQPELSPLPTYPSRNQKKSGRFIKLLLVIIVLAVLAFGGKKLFFSKKQEQIKLPVTPTPTEFQFPTDTPAPTVAQTGTPAPTKQAAINPVDSKTGLDRSSVSVEIQNGSGVVGVASKASDILKGLGYKIGSTGNADNFDYASTEIHVKDSKSQFLPLIKSDLSSSYTISNAASDLDASASADIRVIVGKQ